MGQSRNEYLYTLIEECIESLTNIRHAIYAHAYQDDDSLKTRCKAESVRGASCFHEGVDIVEIIEDIIYDANELLPWMKLPGTNALRLVVPAPACGRKFLNAASHDWKTGPIECNRIVVILGKKVDKIGCVTNIYVKTAYPE